MIIGLVGTIGAGKGVCAKYLGQKGFEYHSLSDEIREELKSRGLPESRDLLTVVGNELRTTFGTGVLAQRVLKKIVPGKNYVVDSIRNPEEVKTLQSRPDFVLVKIDAPARVRFDRIRERARAGDVQTFDDFLLQDEIEAATSDPATQQIRATAEMAEYTILNDSTLEIFHQRIDKLLNELLKSNHESTKFRK
ncbi:MAG: AAA family ATPase [bacterium]|nr:AAA family ATPase [bacterium]